MKNNNSSIFISLIIFLILFALTLPLFLAHELNTDSSLTFLNLLSYYGSILGAGATIGAVVLTINYNKKQNDEERILSVKPYLQSDYTPISNKAIFKEKNDVNTLKINVNLETNRITNSYELPASFISETIEKDPITHIIKSLDYSKKYFIINYSLTNVGAGNALNLLMTINGDTNYALPHFSVTTNQKNEFLVFFKYPENLKAKEISISIKLLYSDINSKSIYEQNDELFIFRCDDNTLSSRKEKTIKPPKGLPHFTIYDLLDLK